MWGYHNIPPFVFEIRGDKNVPSDMCAHKDSNQPAHLYNPISHRFPHEEPLIPWLFKMRPVKMRPVAIQNAPSARKHSLI